MLELKNIDLQFSDHIILEDLNFTLYAGQKIGLVGRNGSGKTSLFAIIKGELSADKGDCNLQQSILMASVEQEIDDTSTPALEFVMLGHKEIGGLWQQIRQFERSEEYEKAVPLYQRLDELHGYSIESQAAEIMHGLGFVGDDVYQPIKSFSGGWRMRIALARTLLAPSDLLLLDEPTNHLDLDAVIWLESWLKKYPGSILLVSHDREFLDNTTDYTLALDDRKARLYKGGYSSYEKQKAEAKALQQKSYEKQQQKREHVESFINRFRAKASKAKQVQGRIKMLARLPQIAAAQADSQYTFEFRETIEAGNPLLRLEKVSFAYEQDNIFSKLDFALNKDDRIGFLGLNGAGKSTLVKLIAAQLNAQLGERKTSSKIRVGYFAQHQLEELHAGNSALAHLKEIAPGKSESELRAYLGGFNFSGNKVFQGVGKFSGGEKARLALALIVWQRPNLLLLDEPTNHLDIEMREALTLALQNYSGALVLVAHDRHLLQASVDEYFLVDDGTVSKFDGDLSDYEKWLKKKREILKKARKSEKKPDINKVIKNIERELDLLHEEVKKIDEKLLRKDTLSESKLLIARKKLLEKTSDLEEEWLNLQQ